ncbi:DUF6752 domain-containing protein [Nocardioides marmoraquaticus]
MDNNLRQRAGEALDLVARARARAGSPRVAARLDAERIEARLAQLEAEVQECRRLHRRLAELTDVVGELLLPVAQRDQEAVDAALARYRSGL